MMPSSDDVSPSAPRAAGMSTTRLSSRTRPGRGAPEGRGEKVASFMGFSSSQRCQGMLLRLPARLEEGVHRGMGDFLEELRAPLRLHVLLHDERANALDEIALLEAAVDEVELHAKAIGERQRAAALDLL